MKVVQHEIVALREGGRDQEIPEDSGGFVVAEFSGPCSYFTGDSIENSSTGGEERLNWTR
jgi:hypothetical protein